MDLAIVPDDECRSKPGDFGARIMGGEAHLPVDVTSSFGAQGIRTALDFLSYSSSFPSAVAHTLGWSVDDVRQATRDLEQRLEPYLDLTAFRAPRRRMRYGALDPATQKKGSR